LTTTAKPDSSFVTDADLASERVILERIRATYPGDLVLSEEAGMSAGDRTPGRHIWVVDPLDGTTNFANAYPFYCISICRGRFRDDGTIDPVAGVVLDVPRNRLYAAERGHGAWLDGKRLRVATVRPLPDCFLMTGFYYQRGDRLQTEIGRFARVAAQCKSVRRDGAAALDLALVAEGVCDAFWENDLKAWDVAAGVLLVEEAGGVVRNYANPTNGAQKPFDIEGAGLVAGNAPTVAAIAALL
jgi:myo-inositol-1(or 4)-monophosphatase